MSEQLTPREKVVKRQKTAVIRPQNIDVLTDYAAKEHKGSTSAAIDYIVHMFFRKDKK
jgi:hypothetical protein